MLSEETAISKNWKNTLKWLSAFLDFNDTKETDKFKETMNHT